MKINIIDRFKKYISISSESGNEKTFADVLINDLENFGLDVIQDKQTKKHHSNTSNVIAYLDGKGTNEKIILCAHMDTVKPGIGIKAIETDGVLRSEGNTILGADDKAGISIIMDALQKITTNSNNHLGIEVVFTVHEEAGLYGSKALDYSLLSSKEAIVFDSSGEVGGIVTKAPSKEKITASVHGVSAHAGIAPKDGINAIAVASEAISNMKLAQVDKDTTANIGTMNGGHATNIVPNKIHITGEVRSFRERNLDNQINHMMECFENSADKHRAGTKINRDLEYKSYNLSDDLPIVKKLLTAGKAININMFTRNSQGGSDANVFNQNGIATVNFAIGTQAAHTIDEHIKKESLVNASRILYKFLTLI